MEKEREENIWRRITFYFRRIKNGEGKGGKYLERENIFCEGEGKGGNYLEK